MNHILRVFLLTGLLGLAACEPVGPRSRSGDFPAPPDPSGASAVLVTLDTVRSDAVGCGGSPTAHTPWIDRLARRGAQFRTGLAATPITAPSHASVLTGQNPPAHGVRDNGTFHLPESVPTVAQSLGAQGIATGGFVAAFPLLGRFGFSRGFDHFDDEIGDTAASSSFQQAQRPGDRVVEAATAWIRQIAEGQRYFAWVHLFDAHVPNDAPRAWVWAASGNEYAGDVALTDDHLGGLIRFLEADGRPVWLLLTADHGESLGDHGEETHAIFVYDATIRVPAVLWPAPDRLRPGLNNRTFRGIDTPATLALLLGLDPSGAPGTGRALGPAAGMGDGAAAAYAESFYPRIHYGWSEIRSVREDGWKLIRTSDPELYDLDEDPAESRNVYEEHPDIVERLQERLATLAAATAVAPSVVLDDAEREALESLGYVTDQAAAADTGMRRPDAKRMMRVQDLLYDAMHALAARNPQEAIRRLQTALSRDPTNPEIHRVMGMSHAAAGRDESALDSLLRARELAGDEDDAIRLEIAAVLMRLARPDEAATEFQILVERDSANTDFRYNLGVARHAQGRIPEARALWQEAVELDPFNADALDALRRTAGAEKAAAEKVAAEKAAAAKAAAAQAEAKAAADSTHPDDGP